MIISDCHMHTTYSSDGKSDMESMILASIDKGLRTICFTEHNDHGAGFYEGGDYVVDTEEYFEGYKRLSEKYRNKIEVLFGVEIGLMEKELDFFNEYTAQYPFDFVIGSSHTAGLFDPYYPEYYTHFEDTESAYRYYFESELKRAELYDCYDSYGHLDYALRYGPGKNSCFTYERFADILDPLLLAIIKRGKVIEINSSGYKAGMGGPNPARSIILRYSELGGLPPTIGADAHHTSFIAYEFEAVEKILREAGYTSYSIFRNRIREEISL